MTNRVVTDGRFEGSVERRPLMAGVARCARSSKRIGLPRLLVLVVAASTAVVVLAGGASARSAALSAEGLAITISGNAPGLLEPGAAAQRIDLVFSNPNDDSVSVSGLTVTVQSFSAPHATGPLPCTAASFALTQFGGSSQFSIPPGTSTLQSLGFPQATWPAVQMIETHQNQDGCIGATITFGYGASGQDGPAASTPSTTVVGGTYHPAGSERHDDDDPVRSSHGQAAEDQPAAGDAADRRGRDGEVHDRRHEHERGQADRRHGGRSRRARLRPLAGRDGGRSEHEVLLQPGRVKAAFTNIATMSGKTSSGSTVSASTSAIVKLSAPLAPPLVSRLAIRIAPKSQKLVTLVASHKKGNATTVSVSYPTAHFKIKVTNTGNGVLHKVKVTDAGAHGCDHRIGSLAAGKSRTFGCAAMLVTKSFTNVAVESGKNAKGKSVKARAMAKVEDRTKTGVTVARAKTAPGISVTKTKTKTGVTVTLNIPDVLFAFNRSTLQHGAAATLAEVVNLLNTSYARGHVTVTGYTDDIGTAAYNLGLSQRRATTVASYLERHGSR